MRERTASQNVLHYLLSDHLGSTSVVTDGQGNLEQVRRYRPFGAPQGTPSAPGAVDRWFTGQRSEEGQLGSLYDYGARFYSPRLGGFISPDAIVPDPGNPQALNRYTYVFNRPLVLNDPSGRCPVCIIVIALLAAAVDTFAVPDTAYAPDLTTDIAALPPSAAPPERHAVVMGYTAVGAYLAPQMAGTLIAGACADGDCFNELQRAEQGLEQVNRTVPEPVARGTILNSDWTVLGRYKDYVSTAARFHANYFSMPIEEWNALGSRAAQWAVNREYLDKAIAAGQSFLLATEFKDGIAATESFYHQELVYLLQQGYELVVVDGQQWLIKAAAQ